MIADLRAVLFAALLLACQSAPPPKDLGRYTDEESLAMAEAMPAAPAAAPRAPRRLLVFSLCEGYRHESIPAVEKALRIMGEITGAFTPVFSTDMACFEPESLSFFDAVLFNNTTQLKFASPAQRQALLDFVQGGKGVIGIHAATDCFYEWPEAAEMLGGLFDGHPWHAGGTWAFKIDEPDHPLNAAFCGRGFLISDEIYQIKEPYSRAALRVLLSLDMSNPRNREVEGVHREDRDFAVSWIRPFGAGRVFYCSLGHNPVVLRYPGVLGHYLAGIQYALGDLPADDAPSATLETTPAPALTTGPEDVDGPYAVLARIEFGDSRAVLSAFEESIRAATPDERAEIEARLLEVLTAPATTRAGRQFACRLLQRVATPRSVPALAALLDDPEMAHMARLVLHGTSFRHADAAMRDALPHLSGDLRLGVIDTLAARGDREAAHYLAELAAGEDAITARAAILALGRIGGADAASMLSNLKVPEELRAAWLDARLVCADRLRSEGLDPEAETIYEELSAASQPPACRAAAWRGLLQLHPDKAGTQLAALFRDPEPRLRQAAAKYLSEMGARANAAPVIAAWPELPADAQGMALLALAERGDRAAAPAALSALDSAHAEVRLAGLQALGRIGAAEHVERLARAAVLEGDEGQAAAQSLAELPAAGADEAMLRCLEQTEDGAVRAALLSCLVERRPAGLVPVLLARAADEEAAVRLAALRGLAACAAAADLPGLLGLLARVASDEERGELEGALAAACGRTDGGAEAVPLLAAALAGKDAPARASLLRVLGRMPSASSLEPLLTAAADADAEPRAAAIAALADWPDAAPADALLAAARAGTSTEERARALGGYLRLAGLGGERSPQEMRAIFDQAWELARTPEEKEVVIARAGEAQGFWTLSFLEPLGADAAVGAAAQQAYEKAASALARRVDHGAEGCAVTLALPPSEKYQAGGQNALTDGEWGSESFSDGRWQGFKGESLEAVIDLGREVEVEDLRAGFLSDMNSWIFPPVRVEFSLSLDGAVYETVGLFEPGAPAAEEDRQLRDFHVRVERKRARFVRVAARNIGALPDWHRGAGEAAWLFADEIQVNPRFEQ